MTQVDSTAGYRVLCTRPRTCCADDTRHTLLQGGHPVPGANLAISSTVVPAHRRRVDMLWFVGDVCIAVHPRKRSGDEAHAVIAVR